MLKIEGGGGVSVWPRCAWGRAKVGGSAVGNLQPFCLCLLTVVALAAGSSGLRAQAVDFNATPVSPGIVNGPFVADGGSLLTMWTPAQLSAASGLLTHIGLQFTTPVSIRWASVKITVGETTNTGATLSPVFASNFNTASPPVVCHDGPAKVVTTAVDSVFRIPLRSVYSYAGVNNLCVLFEVNGRGVGDGFPILRTQIQTTVVNSNVVSTVAPVPVMGMVNSGAALGAAFTFVPMTPGTAVRVARCDFVGGSAAIGTPNIVEVDIQNTGTVALSGTPLTLRYSLDLGTTWIHASTVLTTFTPLQTVTLTFPSSASSLVPGPLTLSAGLFPFPLPAPPLATKTFTPDLDISLLQVPVSEFPLNTPLPLQVRVTNNGDWRLTGPIPITTTINGINFATHTPVLASPLLPGQSAILSLAPQTFTTKGSYTISAAISPQLTGDPDASDVTSLTLPFVGMSSVQTSLGPPTAQPLMGTGPFMRQSGIDPNGTILYSALYKASEFPAIPPGSVIRGLAIHRTGSGGSATSNSLRLWLRNSTFLNFPFTQTFGGVLAGTGYSGPQAPSQEVFNSTAFMISESTPWIAVGPFAAANPFQYLGTGIEVTTEWSCTTSPAFYGTTGGIYFAPGPYEEGGNVLTHHLSVAASISGGSPASPIIPMTQNVPPLGSGKPTLRIYYDPFEVPIEVVSLKVQSPHVRPNGSRDVYRGMQGIPVELVLRNSTAYTVTISALQFGTLPALGPGVVFSTGSLPVTIPPNTQSFPVTGLAMSLALQSVSSTPVPTTLSLTGITGTISGGPTAIAPIIPLPHPPDAFVVFDPPEPSPMVVASAVLNPAVHTVGYVQPLHVTGGSGLYTWSIIPTSPQQLPLGLALIPNGSATLPAAIQGTPDPTAATGTYTFHMSVTDGTYVTSAILTLDLSALAPLVFTPVSLAPATEFLPYAMAQPLSATGGSLIYTYSVDPASPSPLPPGLTLDPVTGVISGVPADGTSGTRILLLTVEDGRSIETQLVQLQILPHVLEWRSTSIPDGTRTVAYLESLSAIGGTSPRIYTILSGALPPGLQLSPATGTITGIPTTNGSFTFTCRVTDALNATQDRSFTMTVNDPAPLAMVDSGPVVARIGQPFQHTMLATGGSRTYTYAAAPHANCPFFLTLTPSGVLSGTPVAGSDGVYFIDVVVNDGHSTAPGTVELRILQANATDFAITEIDMATGCLELSNLGPDPVDVSGWRLCCWTASSTSPVSLAFDTLPGITLAMPGSVMTLNFGGTAGGTWPSFNAGVAFPAMTGHDLAWHVMDSHGTTVYFIRTTGINPANLTGPSTAAIHIPADVLAMPPLVPGFANYTRGPTAFFGLAAGTPGTLNPGLATTPLGFHWASPAPAILGISYSSTIVANGGAAPYSYSLAAPAAPWLSIDPVTGSLSGNVPAGQPSTVTLDITVTDAAAASVTRTISLPLVSGPAIAPQIRIGHVSADRADGSLVRVPVTIEATAAATGMNTLSFVVDPPAGNSLELWRVLPGEAAVAAGVRIEAVRISGGRALVICRLAAASTGSIQDGSLAVLVHRVKGNLGGMAATGLAPVTATSPAFETATGIGLATIAGVGSIDISEFRPQDANRDATIDVVDVQLTVNLILALQAKVFPSQGDANRDGLADVVDVQAVVNCILTGGC